MDAKHARGRWIAWFCISFGAAILLISAVRLVNGTGGVLMLVVGLPVLAYGWFMLRAVQRINR